MCQKFNKLQNTEVFNKSKIVKSENAIISGG